MRISDSHNLWLHCISPNFKLTSLIFQSPFSLKAPSKVFIIQRAKSHVLMSEWIDKLMWTGTVNQIVKRKK